jgi:hypothetical protein
MSQRLFLYLLFLSLTVTLPVNGFATELQQEKAVQVLIDEMSQPETVESDPTGPVQALKNWAAAWSNKDFNRYIASYINDYRGTAGSHQQWLQQRRSRIIKSGRIRVTLSDIKIRSRSATRIIIDALQRYESATYKDRVLKRFTLTKINGVWKIGAEQTLDVL